jgi:hypothetical protein
VKGGSCNKKSLDRKTTKMKNFPKKPKCVFGHIQLSKCALTKELGIVGKLKPGDVD